MTVKVPPAYTVLPLTANASTVMFAFGSHAETVWSARMWARLERGIPPTCVKTPPTYQPPDPSRATAFTTPATLGIPSGKPVVASSGTAPPVAGPT